MVDAAAIPKSNWTADSAICESAAMDTRHHCDLEHIDRQRNMQRFYHLSIQPSLFDCDVALVREWGRIGRPGRLSITIHSREEAAVIFRRWHKSKLRKGYRSKDWTANH